MLEPAQIDRIVGKAALATLTSDSFIRAQSEPAVGSDGEDAVLVTIVIRELARHPVSGDSALDTIVRIRHDLERAGEGRMTIIDFATESEIADGRA